ncbi:MAG: hypothetical protein KAX93_00635 [Flavobacterium sp.]|nr:hypothetical protein [Flavobacterium sp.]MBP8156862.1 hypothetical protein [Flavobacterium sp.]
MILKKKNTLVALLIIGFVLLVKGYFLFTTFNHNNLTEATVSKSGDAGHYFKIAKNIAEFYSYADDNSATANESATWRPPVWPFILSFFFYVSKNPLSLLVCKIIFETLILVSALFYFKKKNSYPILFFSLLLLLLIEPQYLKYSATFLSESFTAILALLFMLLFLGLKTQYRFHILIPIIAAITVLCHPVSVFFVVTLLGIYLLFNVKKHFKIGLLHGFLFLAIVLLWPIRNHLLFDKGLYLTASQGATFSKGWNEKVLTNFTNVDGDLADESLNLKYVDSNKIIQSEKGVLEYSKLYQQGTWHYIKSLNFSDQLKIAFKKLSSNFNPFPEKPKAGFFEKLSVVFRILYLVLFAQLFIRILSRKKIDFSATRDKAFMVVFAVFIGQVMMSVYIYTGFRFNSIYSLTLLLCFMLVNENWISEKIIRRLKL